MSVIKIILAFIILLGALELHYFLGFYRGYKAALEHQVGDEVKGDFIIKRLSNFCKKHLKIKYRLKKESCN